MIGLEVRERGSDGATLVRTTIALDGSVVTALRPEVLDAPQVLQRHHDAVGRRMQQWSGRIRQAGQIASYGPYVAIAGASGSLAVAGFEAWRGAIVQAIRWAAVAAAFEVLRRVLPRLARWWVRRWLART